MEILANLQLILFFIPIVSFCVLGLFILLKPVLVVNRRWFLAVVVPLLFANPLALIESSLDNNYRLATDWQFWLVLLVDIALLVGSILIFRGYLVFGLEKSAIMKMLADRLQEKKITTRLRVGDKDGKWRVSPDALILTVELNDKDEDIWVTESMGEVHIRAESKRSLKMVHDAMPTIKQLKKPYRFKQHMMGVLYIVLAVVLGVFGWIFFFEPRLVISS